MTPSLRSHDCWSSRVGTTSEKETFSGDVQATEGTSSSIPQTHLTTRHSNRGVSWCHFQVGGSVVTPQKGLTLERSQEQWSFLVMTSHKEAQSL